jgi:hypothetical protein
VHTLEICLREELRVADPTSWIHAALRRLGHELGQGRLRWADVERVLERCHRGAGFEPGLRLATASLPHASDGRLTAGLLRWKGMFLAGLGSWQEAASDLAAAAAIGKASGDDPCHARAEIEMARLLITRARWGGAEEALTRALEHVGGHPGLASEIDLVRGRAMLGRGQLRDAARLARLVKVRHGARSELGIEAQLILAESARLAGFTPASTGRAEAALTGAREHGLRWLEAEILLSLGHSLLTASPPLADAHVREGLRIAIDASPGGPFPEEAYLGLANVARSRGDIDGVERALSEAERRARVNENPRTRARAEVIRALVLRDRRAWGPALERAERARLVFGELGCVLEEARALEIEAALHPECGSPNGAPLRERAMERYALLRLSRSAGRGERFDRLE